MADTAAKLSIANIRWRVPEGALRLGVGVGLGLVGLWLSWRIWAEIWRLGSEDQTLSYILATPLLAGWLVWVRRHRIRHIAPRFSWIGPGLIAAGLGLFHFSVPMNVDTFWFASGLLVVLGGLMTGLGWQLFIALVPAWLVLGFAIPVPGSVVNALGQPLMTISAMITADLLQTLGLGVKLSGNLLQVAGHPLNVAQACSGLRSFFTLLLLVSTLVFLRPYRWWVRGLMWLLTPVVAITANLVRLAVTALFTAYVGEQAAGVFHDVGGFVTFGLGVLACLGIIRALGWARLRTLNPQWAAAPEGQRSAPSEGRNAEPKALSRRAVWPILAAFGLLAVFGMTAAYPYAGQDLDGYHKRVRNAVMGVRSDLENWSGSEAQLPAAAMTLLKPNASRDIRYQNRRTGRTFTFSLIHCRHARDMAYHTPPVCYPNSGWRLVDTTDRNWQVRGRTLPGREYAFRRLSEAEQLTQIMVANFYVLPDGRFARDRKAAIGNGQMPWQYDPWGVAQVQLIFSRNMPAKRRETIIRSFLDRNWPVFQVIRDGVD